MFAQSMLDIRRVTPGQSHMKKYIDSYRQAALESKTRKRHPKLETFYSSCDYLDRKGVQSFLSGNVVPEDCTPEERAQILRSVLEELLGAGYLPEVSSLSSKLGTEFNQLLESNANLKQLYERSQAAAQPPQKKQKAKKQLPAGSNNSNGPSWKYLGIGLVGLIGIVLLSVKILRWWKKSKALPKALTK